MTGSRKGTMIKLLRDTLGVGYCSFQHIENPSYYEGMTLDPLNAVLPANRAMALLKKGQFAAAETDCTLALSIDNTYIKAFQRRASARTGLDKLSLAIQDYDEVVKLEPKNKAAQTEKAKILEKLKQNSEESTLKKEEVPVSTFNKFEDKMKGALSRTGVKSEPRHEKLEVVGSKTFPAESKNEVIDEGLVLPIQKPVHSRSKKPLKRIEIKELSSSTTLDSPVTKIDEAKGSEKNNVDIATKSTGFTKKIEKEISADLAKVDIVNTIPSVPTNSAKFFTDWKTLKTIVNRAISTAVHYSRL